MRTMSDTRMRIVGIEAMNIQLSTMQSTMTSKETKPIIWMLFSYYWTKAQIQTYMSQGEGGTIRPNILYLTEYRIFWVNLRMNNPKLNLYSFLLSMESILTNLKTTHDPRAGEHTEITHALFFQPWIQAAWVRNYGRSPNCTNKLIFKKYELKKKKHYNSNTTS